MATNLYVGNMSFNAAEGDLGDLFAEFGQVNSVKIITDRDTNRSKGFGFVEMEDQAAAEAAIEKLNGSSWMDRNLVVNVARERTERPRNNFRY
ncbi:MAG: RNA-binding protein [Spirochaetales bacterium]|nr:RNA-binding protein [Spirochaetales bacterium]